MSILDSVNLLNALCDALGLSERVSKISIHLDVRKVPTVEVTLIPEAKELDIGFTEIIKRYELVERDEAVKLKPQSRGA